MQRTIFLFIVTNILYIISMTTMNASYWISYIIYRVIYNQFPHYERYRIKTNLILNPIFLVDVIIYHWRDPKPIFLADIIIYHLSQDDDAFIATVLEASKAEFDAIRDEVATTFVPEFILSSDFYAYFETTAASKSAGISVESPVSEWASDWTWNEMTGTVTLKHRL
jgi:hypothetical protein